VKINLGQLAIRSDDFVHGERLPTYATIDGEGVSPPLSWVAAPEGTRSFALIATDPDAPLTHGFDHWVLYDISPEVTGLAKGAQGIGTAGVNGKREAQWAPATPPVGHGVHQYYFHLFALDQAMELPPGLTRFELLDAIDAHIIEQARIAGTYSRE
jgi:hypothetical protein